jgi:hypothetical protein
MSRRTIKLSEAPTPKEPIKTIYMGTWTTAQNKARSLLVQGYKPTILFDKTNQVWKVEVYD